MTLPGTILLLVTVAFATTTAADERFKIGVPLPLSGEVAAWGVDIKNSLLFANERVGKGRYSLIFEDDRCDTKAAVTVAQKLIKIDKVDAAIGFACSNSLLGPAKAYEEAGIVAITTSAGSSKISGLGKFIFRVFPSNARGALVLFEELRSRRFNKVGLLAEQTDWLTDYSELLTALAKDGPLRITVDSYPPDTKDFRTLLLRLRSQGVEALVLNTQSEAGLLSLVSQLDQVGWKVPRFGNIAPGSPAFIEKAGRLGNGIVFNDVPAIEDSLVPEARALYADFLKQYGKEQTTPLLFATTYAAFQMIDQARSTGRPLQEALRGGQFDTVLGRLSFDPNGDAVPLDQVIKVLDGGTAVVLKR